MTPLESRIERLRELARINDPADFLQWEREQAEWRDLGCPGMAP